MFLQGHNPVVKQELLYWELSENLDNPESFRFIFESIISKAITAGASFCEIFLEDSLSESMRYLNGAQDATSTSIWGGCSVRVVRGSQVGFACTASFQPKSIFWALSQCLASVGLSEPKKSQKSNVIHLGPVVNYSRLYSKMGSDSKKNQFINLSDEIHVLSFDLHQKTPHKIKTSLGLTSHFQKICVANSEGVFATDTRLNQYLSGEALAQRGINRTNSSRRFGCTGNPNYFKQFLYMENLIEPIINSIETMLPADMVEAGDYPIIIANGSGGVIFHEACGHLLETTSLFYKSTPFEGKFGEPIAHEAVSAYDAGHLYGAFGSVDMDDEGMPTSQTLLIEDGILKNFLSDREGARVFGLPRTGSARRQSYEFAPTSRMRNTYISPGPHEVSDLFNSVDRGIYCKQLGGGSVNGAGEFNFGCEEAFEIKNGKIGKPLRGAVVIGKATEILKRISMVANDLAVQPGFCGSQSGTVYVTTGQPHIKVDRLTVGGK